MMKYQILYRVKLRKHMSFTPKPYPDNQEVIHTGPTATQSPIAEFQTRIQNALI